MRITVVNKDELEAMMVLKYRPTILDGRGLFAFRSTARQVLTEVEPARSTLGP